MKYALFSVPVGTIYDLPQTIKEGEAGLVSTIGDEGLYGQACQVRTAPGGVTAAGVTLPPDVAEVVSFYGYHGYVDRRELQFVREEELWEYLGADLVLVGRATDVLSLPKVQGVRMLELERGGVLRRQHETAGVLVDPVHRAEDRAVPPLGRPCCIAVRQRAQRVVQGGVHGEAGRLFQHEGKGILIDDVHRDAALRRNALPLRRQLEGDDLPGLDPAVGQNGDAVGKKAAAPELHSPGKVGRDAAPAQKAAQQRPIRLGRDLEIELHLPTSSAGNI